MAGGRPTKYDTAYNEQVKKLAMLGLTDIELAAYFEVEEKTINNWKKNFPEFLQSLRAGKEVADQEVAMSLYDKAVGGDTTAMIFWLKNRRSSSWRDKQDHMLSGDADNPLTIIERVIVGKTPD
jgi:predicted metal-dependent TIM-barrel fold hydrolase